MVKIASSKKRVKSKPPRQGPAHGPKELSTLGEHCIPGGEFDMTKQPWREEWLKEVHRIGCRGRIQPRTSDYKENLAHNGR